jgi:hypothetical protein
MLQLVEAVNTTISEASELFPETVRRLSDLVDVLKHLTDADEADEIDPVRIAPHVDAVLAYSSTQSLKESEFALCVLLFIGKLLQFGVLPHEAGVIVES